MPGPAGMRELAALIRSASDSLDVRHRQLAARRDWMHVRCNSASADAGPEWPVDCAMRCAAG